MNKKLLYIILSIITLSIIFCDEDNFSGGDDLTNCFGNCYEPIPDAGDDKIYFQGIEITLDGSGSYDPDDPDAPLTFYWTTPTGIDLTGNINNSNPAFFAPTFDTLDSDSCSDDIWQSEEDCLGAGEMWVASGVLYIPITLMVNDGEYDSLIPDEVVFSVVEVNQAPEITVDQTDYEINKLTEFTLDVSASSDESSLTGILDFSWDYGDFITDGGTIIDDSINSIRVLESPSPFSLTTYQITVTISDGFDTVDIVFNVTVLSNAAPLAYTGDDISAFVTTELVLDGTGSLDDDGDVLSYLWDISDCLDAGFSITDGGGGLTSEIITLNAPSDATTCQASLVVSDALISSSQWEGKDLFISEYVEASTSNNSYLEIYNGTESDINLSNYSLTIHRDNGATYDHDLDDGDPSATLLSV